MRCGYESNTTVDESARISGHQIREVGYNCWDEELVVMAEVEAVVTCSGVEWWRWWW